MIHQFSKPGSIYAVVSDSYDLFNAVEYLWGEVLKDSVINAKGMLELYLKAAGQRAEFFVRDEEGKVLKLIKDVSLLPYSTEEAGGFVGCTLGVYASSNGEMSDRFADVAWISYEGIPD
jgi:alpha-N-arabinofuranosidase